VAAIRADLQQAIEVRRTFWTSTIRDRSTHVLEQANAALRDRVGVLEQANAALRDRVGVLEQQQPPLPSPHVRIVFNVWCLTDGCATITQEMDVIRAEVVALRNDLQLRIEEQAKRLDEVNQVR
jgi:hypothetical protein